METFCSSSITLSPPGAQLLKMQNKLLMYDKDVYDALEVQQVRPQYFAFRWITLLFSQDLSLPGRERCFGRLSEAYRKD